MMAVYLRKVLVEGCLEKTMVDSYGKQKTIEIVVDLKINTRKSILKMREMKNQKCLKRLFCDRFDPLLSNLIFNGEKNVFIINNIPFKKKKIVFYLRP